MVIEIEKVKKLVIHCSATRANQYITEEMVRSWHEAKGWIDIGYHVFIRRDGIIEYGRPLDVLGAHVKGHNDNSLGICLAGGLNNDTGEPEDNFTPEQWSSLKKVLKAFLILFEDVDEILGHRDFPGVNKDCPCFDVKTKIKELGISLVK